MIGRVGSGLGSSTWARQQSDPPSQTTQPSRPTMVARYSARPARNRRVARPRQVRTRLRGVFSGCRPWLVAADRSQPRPAVVPQTQLSQALKARDSIPRGADYRRVCQADQGGFWAGDDAANSIQKRTCVVQIGRGRLSSPHPRPDRHRHEGARMRRCSSRRRAPP